MEILGSSLKSEFLIDLFETYDVEVIYIYDRLYEGMDDEYSAEIPEMGLEFLFDSNQRLKTIFMSNVVHTGFNPFGGVDPRKTQFKTGDEAMVWARKNSVPAQHSELQTHPIFGEIPEWVKFQYGTHTKHYQFSGGSIDKVTLSVRNA